MEKIFQLLETAWPAVKATGLTGCVTAPETEDNLLLFEDKYATHIPKDYRQLLSHFGACHFADPQIYTLNDLDRYYPLFFQQWEEYKKEYPSLNNIDPFPVGSFGDGSVAFLDRNSLKIYILIHDFGIFSDDVGDFPCELCFENFGELVEMQVEIILYLQQCGVS